MRWPKKNSTHCPGWVDHYTLYSLAGFEVNEKIRIRVMQGCLVITAE
ncbi:SymE family type I addiction module toxin [Pseudomonas paraeruginosa]